MFWFCDRGSHERRFNQRHMLCGQQRIYDDDLKKCVPSTETPPIIRDAAVRHARQPGSHLMCHGRSLGKYADPTDCRQYFMCLPQKRRATRPFRQLVFRCPQPMAYDPIGGQCNQQGLQRCSQTTVAEHVVGTICPCETRIRQASSDSGESTTCGCIENVLLQLLCPQCRKIGPTTRKQ